MDKFLLYSNLGLWMFLLLQFIAILLLSKILSNFLNRTESLGGSGVKKQQLKAGQRAPYFLLPDQSGHPVEPVDRQNGYDTVILFTLETCGICKHIVPQLPKLHNIGLDLRILVLEDARTKEPNLHAPPGIHYIRDSKVLAHYNIGRTPGYMLIAPDGAIVQSEVIKSYKDLEQHLLAHYGQKAS